MVRKIGTGNHGTDMKAADREQMRQSGVAHRIFVLARNRAAIATCQSRRNRAGRSPQLRKNMPGERVLHPAKWGTGPAGLSTVTSPRSPRRTNPLKPRRFGKIIATRKHRR
jgi:hypothetical protein